MKILPAKIAGQSLLLAILAGTLPVGPAANALEVVGDLIVRPGAKVGKGRAMAGVTFEGEFGGMITQPPGADVGSLFFWYPKKAAIRGGHITSGNSTLWRDSSIGLYSLAFGRNTLASGSFAFAHGNFTTASGPFSFAVGNNNSAAGHAGFAFGSFSDVTNNYGIAMGTNNRVEAPYGVALGQGNKIYEEWSIESGEPTEERLYSGQWGVALGYDNHIYGRASQALGYKNIAYNDYSYLFGRDLAVTGNDVVVLGRYNENLISSEDGLLPEDPLLIIGNGTGPSEEQRTNALVVRKSGDLEINGGLRVTGPILIPEQGDLSMGPFTNGPR